MKQWNQIFQRLSEFVNGALPMDPKVKYSVKKYSKTYGLLEKYDQEALSDPKVLAEPERLSPYIRELQKGSRNARRTDSAV